MFYDFNRHKRPAASENKTLEIRSFRARLQNLLARIPEKIKMPVLILLISLTGLGFLRLIIDGITTEQLPEFSKSDSWQYYWKSPQPFEKYLNSLEYVHIQDSLSNSSPKR
ncbi:hypothetical protein [Dyadobacter frigoris]|uniref:Uncharacterized protein n=1 Tax=Dyadobacter frigoris TaxID=2576211 RepID=A0A4U6CN07_9BACT|nr:hypothetical protein [Dyadobacter frigoris]TKT85740.1 hypothetical protein FDK13_33445 [Dyadobacter frigoris]